MLPIDDITFWMSGSNTFTANILTVNGQQDNYGYNNSYSSSFEDIHVYPEGDIYIIQLNTNNYGFQNSYTLEDGDGNLLFERNNCENNTTYNDVIQWFAGCYKLNIEDSGDNGLEFLAST